MFKEEKGIRFILLVYLAMLLLGTVLANTWLVNVVRENEESFYIGSLISNSMKYNSASLFLYLLMERGKQWIILICILLILPKKSGLYIVSAGAGFIFSMMLSIQTMYDGVKGVLMFLTALLPQVIFYGGVIIETARLIINYRSRDKMLSKRNYIFMFLFLNMLYIVGVLLESYVNPKCMNIFL